MFDDHFALEIVMFTHVGSVWWSSSETVCTLHRKESSLCRKNEEKIGEAWSDFPPDLLAHYYSLDSIPQKYWDYSRRRGSGA